MRSLPGICLVVVVVFFFLFPCLFKFKICWIYLVPFGGGDVTITGHSHSQVEVVSYSADSDEVSSCASSSVAMPEWRNSVHVQNHHLFWLGNSLKPILKDWQWHSCLTRLWIFMLFVATTQIYTLLNMGKKKNQNQRIMKYPEALLYAGVSFSTSYLCVSPYTSKESLNWTETESWVLQRGVLAYEYLLLCVISPSLFVVKVRTPGSGHRFSAFVTLSSFSQWNNTL